MNVETLSPDACAMLMACSYVGLERTGAVTPLTLKEWNILASKIQLSPLRTPGNLLGLNASDLQNTLALTPAEAQRLSGLLQRGAAVAFELENLMNAGIRIVTRADRHYPSRLKIKLNAQAPVLLFYAGDLNLAVQNGIAIVGSRAVDQAGIDFTAMLAECCAQNRLNVVSGAAKGVDITAMKSALEHSGTCLGVLSDSLSKKIREREARQYLFEERLLLLSPFHPNSGFTVANAMSRNKLIYALADYAVAISSDFGKGGTWAGATENIKHKYTPMLVRADGEAPAGNVALLQQGVAGLTATELQAYGNNLLSLFEQKLSQDEFDASPAGQMTLFHSVN